MRLHLHIQRSVSDALFVGLVISRRRSSSGGVSVCHCQGLLIIDFPGRSSCQKPNAQCSLRSLLYPLLLIQSIAHSQQAEHSSQRP